MKRKKKESKLTEFLRLAKENGMTYAELQVKESKGEVKIIEGMLFKVNKDGYFEPYE